MVNGDKAKRFERKEDNKNWRQRMCTTLFGGFSEGISCSGGEVRTTRSVVGALAGACGSSVTIAPVFSVKQEVRLSAGWE